MLYHLEKSHCYSSHSSLVLILCSPSYLSLLYTFYNVSFPTYIYLCSHLTSSSFPSSFLLTIFAKLLIPFTKFIYIPVPPQAGSSLRFLTYTWFLPPNFVIQSFSGTFCEPQRNKYIFVHFFSSDRSQVILHTINTQQLGENVMTEDSFLVSDLRSNASAAKHFQERRHKVFPKADITRWDVNAPNQTWPFWFHQR